MPKKSKKQKILADLRRKKVTPAKTELPMNSSTLKSTSPYQFSVTGHTKHTESRNIPESSELVLIKRDLTKTILLAVVAIAIEFALYWKW